jgi:hypothetical protein
LKYQFSGILEGFFCVINMTKIEHIQNHLDQKLAVKPAGMSIINPDNKMSPKVQADWLISLLTRMYFSHGITKNPEQVVKSISNGDCRCWFAIEDDKPVACAAQVKQEDGSVELGRAVSLHSPAGSLVMLSAALDHLQQNTSPLVAEVRVAAEFSGIPGGRATQNICLNHLGLTPHALVPAFGHGDPFRQEPFAFATSRIISESHPFFIPDDNKSKNLLNLSAISLAIAGILPHLKTHSSPGSNEKHGWEIVQSAPFSILTPTSMGSDLENVQKEAEKQSVFSLILLEATDTNVGLIVCAFNAGFIPCGVDRNLGDLGHPVLLMGKLRTGTTLAPIEISSGLPKAQQKPMIFIDSLFRMLK